MKEVEVGLYTFSGMTPIRVGEV